MTKRLSFQGTPAQDNDILLNDGKMNNEIFTRIELLSKI
jgi:hypothetical protein